MFLSTAREIIEGFAYEASSGQLVIDQHASDEQHLRSPATHTEQPLYRCRTYVGNLMPREWLNRRGKFMVDRTVTTNGEVISVQISFVPTT